MEYLKHFWEIGIAMLSGGMSLIFYTHKQNQKKSDALIKAVQHHQTKVEVFEQQIASITEDVTEIKADVKTLMYRLLGNVEPTPIRKIKRK